MDQPDGARNLYVFSALRTPGCSADFQSVVFGTQKPSDVLSLSPREERAGRESERGEIDKKRLLSPALSSFFVEERERKRGWQLNANLLPNRTGRRPALRFGRGCGALGTILRGPITNKTETATSFSLACRYRPSACYQGPESSAANRPAMHPCNPAPGRDTLRMRCCSTAS